MAAVGRVATLAEVPDIVAQAATLVDEAPLAEAIYVATAKAAMLGADDSDIEAEDETVIAPERFARWGGCCAHSGKLNVTQGTSEPPSPVELAPPGSAFGVDNAADSCSGVAPSSSAESPEARTFRSGPSDFCGVDGAGLLSKDGSAQPGESRFESGRGTHPVGQLIGRQAKPASSRRGWPASASPLALAARAGRPGSKSFTDAVVEFRSRGAVTRDVFDAMTAEERARSFTVARLVTDQGVAVVQEELARAIEAGESLRKFRVNLRQRMQSSGIAIAPRWRTRGDEATLDALDASHVETVYRNGVMSAYSAGRAKHMTQPHIVAARPYWQVMTVNDGPPRQRRTHQAVHGWVMRADDPGWQTTYYPAGHR